MAETIRMPKLGFDMSEGTLIRWMKKAGENINKGEILAEIETDKATVEVESSATGVVRKLLMDEGTVVPVNTPIAIVGSANETIEDLATLMAGQRIEDVGMPGVISSQALPVSGSPPPGKPVFTPIAGRVIASPLAKKIAHDRNVDLSGVKGSGPGGRIVRRDIETALRGEAKPMDQGTQTAVEGQSSWEDQALIATGESVSLSKLRQAIGRRMSEAKTVIPHFYVTHEFKMDALLNLRTQYNQIVPENEKLSVNDFIIKAVALTLRQFPNLNASLNGNAVLHHGQVNIGIAVSIEGGLLTIVCREPDLKSLPQISAEVKAMAERAREGKVKPEEIEGSTFSISNLGMFDVENFAAIINPPEAAIIAVGSAMEVPVVESDRIRPGRRMKATISVDHRISDGVEAARFMQALAVYLEEPLRLMI